MTSKDKSVCNTHATTISRTVGVTSFLDPEPISKDRIFEIADVCGVPLRAIDDETLNDCVSRLILSIERQVTLRLYFLLELAGEHREDEGHAS